MKKHHIPFAISILRSDAATPSLQQARAIKKSHPTHSSNIPGEDDEMMQSFQNYKNHPYENNNNNVNSESQKRRKLDQEQTYNNYQGPMQTNSNVQKFEYSLNL